MDTGAEVLLEGPRGRRLCLELAMMLDPTVASAVFYLGYELDPGRGTSVKLLSVSGDDGGAPPVPSLEDLTGALEALDPGSAGADQIDGALVRAVDSSRPWQEPDGEDALAALPEVQAALVPLARRVLDTPSAQWWNQFRPAGQWALHWSPAGNPAPPRHTAAETLSAWAAGARSEEASAARDRPADPHANWTGTWWSFPEGALRTVARLPLSLDLIEDSFGETSVSVTGVRGAGRTYEVRSGSDWAALCREYPFPVTASRRHDWFRCTGRHGEWVIPDWEKAAEKWDAVHVTALAYLSCANRALDVDAGRSTVMAGWNPDTTIWLTDAAGEDGPPERWYRTATGEPWVRET